MSAPEAAPVLGHVQDLLTQTEFAGDGKTLGRILIQVIRLHLEQYEAHVAANIQLAVGGPDTTVALAPPAATVDGQVLPDNDPIQIAILESITATLSTASSTSPSPSSLPSSPPPRSPPKLIHEAAARIILELERVSAPDEIRRLLPRLPPNVIDALQDTVLPRPELPYALVAPTLDLLTKVVQPQNLSGDVIPTTKNSSDDDVRMQLDPDGLDDLEKVRAFARARASLLDDWVLDNERIMRARLVLDDPTRRDSVEKAVEALRSIHPPSPSPYSSDGDSSNSYIVDTSSSHWDKFLVALGRDGRHAFTPKTRVNADLVTESTWAWTIQRPVGNEVPGVTILDQYRRSVVIVNKLQTYMRRFDRLTKNVFRGLNWDNIFVAGGIALGALLSDGSEDSEHAWRKSDIDIFLTGLTTEECTTKLHHIEKVVASNLPPPQWDENDNVSRSYAVIRTASTITFCPADPSYRRIQVVLRIFPNPMSVLLDFDLDQVTIGRTGDEVYMLPRCARSIITGFTVFTMDLVQGSWLTPRSSTYPSRIFKYAYRGFGLRFLASFLSVLPTAPMSETTTHDASVLESSLARDALSVTLREERLRIRWWLAQQQQRNLEENGVAELKFSDMRKQMRDSFRSGEENCLGPGWQLFCRQVVLMELRHVPGIFADVAAQIAATGSDEVSALNQLPPAPQKNHGFLTTYDSTPFIKWTPEQGLIKLKEAVDDVSAEDELNLSRGLEQMFRLYNGTEVKAAMDECCTQRLPLKRAIFGARVDEVLAEPLTSLILLPKNFRRLAESHLPPGHFRMVNVIKPKYQPVHAHFSLAHIEGHLDEFPDFTRDPERASFPLPLERSTAVEDPDLDLVYFCQDGVNTFPSRSSSGGTSTAATPKLYWQLVSRTEDEIRDVLTAVQRTHTKFTGYMHAHLFRHLALQKYLLGWVERPTKTDELDEFAKWVMKEAQLKNLRRRDNVGNILHAPRKAVFERFSLSLSQMAELETDGKIPSFHTAEGAVRFEQMATWFRRRLRTNGV